MKSLTEVIACGRCGRKRWSNSSRKSGDCRDCISLPHHETADEPWVQWARRANGIWYPLTPRPTEEDIAS